MISDAKRACGGILAAAISCLFITSCNEQKSNAQNDPSHKKQVKVVRALESSLPRSISVSGTLAAEEEVVLSMKVPGRVLGVNVDLGSPVRRGQPLVKLEPADFDLRVRQSEAAYQQARVRLSLSPDGNDDASNLNPEDTGVVRQAKAVLEQARITRERMSSLNQDGLVPKSQLDDANAQYQVADARYQDALEEVRSRQGLMIQRRAELDIARKQRSDSVLSSPIDGIISEKKVNQGQFVAAGDAVLTMVRVNPLRLKLSIPERDASNVRVGQNVDLTLEGDSNVYTGHVARVSPAISVDNRTLMAEAEIANEKGLLRPGSFARAEIVTRSAEPVVLIPASSVITFAGLTKVLSVENNETTEKRIKVGRTSKGSVEVLEGIQAGEAVVIEPGSLTAGEKVTPVW
jgi:RND family efflux transporter MFP subunit